MSDRIPINTAAAIARAHGYDQVIILARRVGENGLEWVTTYGKDRIHCQAAAQIGRALRDNVVPTIESLQKALMRCEFENGELRGELRRAKGEDW